MPEAAALVGAGPAVLVEAGGEPAGVAARRVADLAAVRAGGPDGQVGAAALVRDSGHVAPLVFAWQSYSAWSAAIFASHSAVWTRPRARSALYMFRAVTGPGPRRAGSSRVHVISGPVSISAVPNRPGKRNLMRCLPGRGAGLRAG